MAREATNKNEEHDRLLDELLKGKAPEQILGENGLLKQMTKRMVERALAAELTAHLGYDPHERGPAPRDNARNGTNPKTVIGETGPLEIEVPRDRAGTFEPVLGYGYKGDATHCPSEFSVAQAGGTVTRDLRASPVSG